MPRTTHAIILPVVFSFLAFASALSTVCAQATARLYRYEVSVSTRDVDYRGEISSTGTPTGHYYKVERDSLGRITRVAEYRGTHEFYVYSNLYNGSNPYPDSSEYFLNGKKFKIEQYQRNSSGLIVREEDRTAQGELTQYSIAEGTRDSVEIFWHNAANQYTYHEVWRFGPSGAMIRCIGYHSPVSGGSPASSDRYSDDEIDEQTGLTRFSRHYYGGRLAGSTKITYDTNGDTLRSDNYRADGSRYAVDEYSEGLRTRTIYKYSGFDHEVRYAYDDNRWLTQSAIYVKNQLKCTLTFERSSDATVQRTLAVGPDGSLWAEYPLPIVTDVDRRGHPAGRSDGSLHRTGKWW